MALGLFERLGHVVVKVHDVAVELVVAAKERRLGVEQSVDRRTRLWRRREPLLAHG